MHAKLFALLVSGCALASCVSDGDGGAVIFIEPDGSQSSSGSAMTDGSSLVEDSGNPSRDASTLDAMNTTDGTPPMADGQMPGSRFPWEDRCGLNGWTYCNNFDAPLSTDDWTTMGEAKASVTGINSALVLPAGSSASYGKPVSEGLAFSVSGFLPGRGSGSEVVVGNCRLTFLVSEIQFEITAPGMSPNIGAPLKADGKYNLLFVRQVSATGKDEVAVSIDAQRKVLPCFPADMKNEVRFVNGGVSDPKAGDVAIQFMRAR
jgi:hypothetical protein